MTGYRSKKRIALLLTLLLLLTALPLGAGANGAKDVSFVNVLLSIGDVQSLSIRVNGAYRIAPGGAGISGGRLTASAEGSTVRLTHSTAGELYSGASVTVEREVLGRDGGTLTMTVSGASRAYLGHLTLTARNGKLQAVNRVPLSHYLYGVIAYEMSNSFPVEALKAQSVAAKNYVLPRMGSGKAYDIGDTASDQVYKGYNAAHTNVITAVDATMGDVLLLNGGIMPCYYSASNGGYMVKPSANWSGGKAYDAGYREAYDEYDVRNPESPTETLFVPSDFTKRNVKNDALFTAVNDALTAALELPDTIPNGYRFDRLVRIDRAVSTDDNGSTAGRSHTRVLFTAAVAVKAETENAPMRMAAAPAPEPTTTPTPTPAAAPVAMPTSEPESAQTPEQAGSPAVAASEEIPASGDMPISAQEGAPVEPASAPTAAPEAENETGNAPEETPAQDAPVPMLLSAPVSLADTLGSEAEVPVSFTVTLAALTEAGLYTKTNLRSFCALDTDGGFSLVRARYGHGVGMSQRGAQQMANEGKSYRDIIAFYYGGATLSPYNYALPEGGSAPTPPPATPAASTPTPVPTPGGSPITVVVTPDVSAPTPTPTHAPASTPKPTPGGSSVTVVVTPDASAPTPTPAPTPIPDATAVPTATPSGKTTASALVKGSDAVLRERASSSGKRVAKLLRDTPITVSGLAGDWYAVRVDATGDAGFLPAASVALLSDTPMARGYVNGSSVNIRNGSSTRDASLGKLDKNEPLSVYGLVNGWYRVCAEQSGITGYIIKRYVRITSAPATPPPFVPLPMPTPTDIGNGTYTVTVTADGSPSIDVPTAPMDTGTSSASPFSAYGQINATRVNFRQGPSTATKSMGKLDRPERLGIYEKLGSWYRVRLLSENRDGYVYAKYITLIGDTGSGSAPSAAPSDTAVGAYINASAVNIRAGASTRYTSYGKLKKHTALTVLGSDGSWYRVRIDCTGQVGYVFGKYVTIGTAAPQPSTTVPAPAVKPQTGRATVNAGLLNLRDKPSTGNGSKVLASIRLGYTVTVHSIVGEWAYVTYNGTKGYCIAKCLILQ